MPSNVESPRKYYEDTSQWTNWVFDWGATCHMTPEISDFIMGSLVETDKYIEVADGIFFTAKQTGEVQTKMRDDNGEPFLATLYSVLFALDLWDWIFP